MSVLRAGTCMLLVSRFPGSPLIDIRAPDFIKLETDLGHEHVLINTENSLQYLWQYEAF